MINVTKTYLPEFDTYSAILRRSWDTGWITNNGALLRQLEQDIRMKLEVPNLLVTSNGTIVLQMALQAVGAAGGEVITTPFSYVATSNAIAWEKCKPIFADIDPSTYCINSATVESLITNNTRAILATHVFGIPCNVDALNAIGTKYQIPIIYDGAHSFGVRMRGLSLLSYGDISTCSFHATKLFHMVEGGCVVAKDLSVAKKLELSRQFGHIGDDYLSVGINGKNSELHAAMGLAILPVLDNLISERKDHFELYERLLDECPVNILTPSTIAGLEWNYSYFPVLFKTEMIMLKVKSELEKNDIFPRRYFYPALNTLKFYGSNQACPVAEDIAPRILCLPFYNGLTQKDINYISFLVKSILSEN